MQVDYINDICLIQIPRLPVNIVIDKAAGRIEVGCEHHTHDTWKSLSRADIEAYAFMHDLSKATCTELWAKYRDKVLALCA